MPVLRSGIIACAVLCALASCGRTNTTNGPAGSPAPAATATPGPVAGRPAPAPKASHAPIARATPAPPAPAAAPSASPSGAPRVTLPSPAPTATVPRLPPDAPPQILDVQVSETEVRPGDDVFGSVVTSSNVASVEARIGGYGMTLHKSGVGRFQLTYKVGRLPWFVRGNFTMLVTARNARGDVVTRAIPLRVR
jgi:hypothetical protein